MKNDSTKETISFLLELLKRYDHYIATTNVKAGLLLSFLSMVIFGVVLRLSTNNYTNNVLTNLFFISAILLLVSCLFVIRKLLHVVLPNTLSGRQSNSLVFFGDIAKLKCSKHYLEKLDSSTMKGLKDDLAKQVYFVAKVTDSKFTTLSKASNCIK